MKPRRGVKYFLKWKVVMVVDSVRDVCEKSLFVDVQLLVFACLRLCPAADSDGPADTASRGATGTSSRLVAAVRPFEYWSG